MNSSAPYVKYSNLYDELVILINEANGRIIREEPDPYIYNNANFFIKSFLIVACTYLESYLKEISEQVIEKYEKTLLEHPLPYNLIKWGVDNNKDKQFKFENFELGIKKKDIDDIISGNVHKTINLFTKLGIEITSEERFSNNKDVVGTIVTKRNNIVHHNDDASDVSFPDIMDYIKIFKEYLKAIDDKVLATALF
ncbi:HEPN domain-containing protein [Paenibacillus elgii]